MGAELVLTYKGEDVADIGRSHKYFRDLLMTTTGSRKTFDLINAKLSEAEHRFTKQMFLHIMALNPDNLGEMKETIGDILELYKDECVKAGRSFAVLEAIDEFNDLKIRESI